MRWPDEINGSARSAVWLNKLLRACKYHAYHGGPGVRVSKGTHGAASEIDAARGGGGSPVQQYRLKSIQNDFYTCRSWNGTSEGASDVFIARPQQHRLSEFHNRSIAYSSDGDSFTAQFVYTSATKRTKTIAGTAEVQVLLPYFKTEFDLIYAVRVTEPITVGAAQTRLTDPNDEPIQLLDLNVDGRAWAKLE